MRAIIGQKEMSLNEIARATTTATSTTVTTTARAIESIYWHEIVF